MSRKTGKGQFSPSAAYNLSFLTRSHLLRSESPREFEQLLSALKDEIQPHGVIEEMYVAETAIIIWDILRLRRCKVTMLNRALWRAIRDFIHESSWEAIPDEDREPYHPLELNLSFFEPSESERERWRMERERSRMERERSLKVSDLANRWFSSTSAKQKVASILRKSHQDESAIEAKAIQSSSKELDWLEKMLTALEARRDKLLHRIAEYRESFADRVSAGVDRIIDAEPSRLPRLEDGTKKSAA